MSSEFPVRIAIVGAGPGGLTLARILQLSDIYATITVYERDPSPTYRPQGGSLDLHGESGQAALKAANLFNEFRKYARYEDEGMKITDKDGKVWLAEEGPFGPPPDEGEDAGRPEIDRTQLRGILLDSLSPSTVRWGHALQSVEPVVSEGVNEYKLRFANGQEATADLVVGADGTWSQVRPAVIQTLPQYAGVWFIDLTIPKASPEISALVGPGLIFALSGARNILAQRNSGDVIRVYALLREPADYIDNHPDLIKSLANIEAEFKGWNESILGLIRSADPTSIIPRKIYAFPVPLPYPPSNNSGYERPSNLGGITLLGDAAHVMSPFAGEGVNLAMIDAADLAQAIIGALQPKPDLSTTKAKVEFQQLLSNSLRVFESRMGTRASEKATESAGNLLLALSDTAPLEFVEKIKSFGPPPDSN
ncbi:FAD/NAD(P)-binding domain-containing protein [Sistotremastrum suecicum HHB10207 ss-3]|uniref:FAD/NAD(P)-binding domain-containing protein n=1 Tax=Sistotremastrum suecicum HHB10207 ss-3 TaxID=1314776 RepID=A0A165YZ25_9AGAM|nr:FAD/NAD(P)-binding domain-containing protein [Sistotremastrum suecicum HHB10207 ss-3]